MLLVFFSEQRLKILQMQDVAVVLDLQRFSPRAFLRAPTLDSCWEYLSSWRLPVSTARGQGFPPGMRKYDQSSAVTATPRNIGFNLHAPDSRI